MMKCTQCGSEYEGNFCPNCGASENPATLSPRAIPYERWENTHITSSLEWFGWIIVIGCLPIVGTIIMLCCAKDKSARNYAKLWLILFIIAIIVAMCAVVLPFVLGRK